MIPPVPIRWTRSVLPFAGAYFLSYLFRTANAVIGPQLRGELALSAGEIGLLTAAYFLAFASAQIPLGVLLDRFGARRVESALLLVAGAGAAVFAASPGVLGLAAGRALVGLGVSACLMGAFQSFSRTFGVARQASLTGWMLTAGMLGAITSAYPMEAALERTGWRTIFAALSIATLAASAWLFLRAPPEPAGAGGAPQPRSAQWRGVAAVFVSPHFWRYAPLGITFTGGFMAVQGLWGTAWLMEVNGLARAAAAAHLTELNGAMLAGYLAIGLAADGLARRGVDAARLVSFGVPAALAALLGIVSGATGHTHFLWIAYGAFSCSGTLAFAALARNFPAELAGRANTALNVVVFLGAFGIQWGIGAAIDLLCARGLAPAAAHRAAFWALLAAQALSWAWLALAARWASGTRIEALSPPPERYRVPGRQPGGPP